MTIPSVKEAPCGSWHSLISAELVTAGGVAVSDPRMDGPDLYWQELRPADGRMVIVRRSAAGEQAALTASPFNVRSRVHEYGGGAYTVAGGRLFFTNFADTHVYRLDPGGEPRAIDTEPGMRFADFVVDARRSRLICVREDHNGVGGQSAVNTLAAIPLDGGPSQVLVAGGDFYASARLSPDGSQLAWLTWNHPNMPWDGTELWVGQFGPDGLIGEAHQVAGGPQESIFQPEWSPDGVLHFVSDRTGWWNLYRWTAQGAEALLPMEAEFGAPQWVFGMRTYAFASVHQIICAYSQQGIWHLGRLNPDSRHWEPLDLPFVAISGLSANATHATFTGGLPTEPGGIVRLDLGTGQWEMVRRSADLAIDPALVSVAEPITFETAGRMQSYGLFYAPRNPDYRVPADELPPLLVWSHGGPTSAASPSFDLNVQYWTSRGFAVLNVNYGGSTGYGRAYRRRLEGTWGLVDVNDCVDGALFLFQAGRVDGRRLSIAGASAGGFTTLAALTFRDVFRAGASYFGVSDLALLAADTHKFESRYLERLVGPYPETLEIYQARSPINFVEQLACPVIFFQGLEDRVVPPSQAERMVTALKQGGIPVAYLSFEGEGHGFRLGANNRRCLEAELYFYSRIYGFTPADAIAPITIENL